MFPNQHLLLRQCGKFCVLDRMLVKLHRMGHRVLLFCTMTRLLDQLEQYLRWRRLGPDVGDQMQYLRIDGSTSLEERWGFGLQAGRTGCILSLLWTNLLLGQLRNQISCYTFLCLLDTSTRNKHHIDLP